MNKSDRHLSTSSRISGSATPHFAMSAAVETSRRGDADADATARRTASSIPSRYETLPRADTAREGFGSSSYRKFRVGDAPGAGTYHLAGDIAETSTSVGAKGFGALASGASRLTPEDPSLVPGPGQYTARHPESRMRFCRAPATSPFASSSVDRAPTNPDADAPGPADYHPERPRLEGLVGESAFRSATRRFGSSADADVAVGPSPASYNNLTTRYRTSFAPATAGASPHPRAPSRPSASSAFRGPSPRAPPRGGLTVVAGVPALASVANGPSAGTAGAATRRASVAPTGYRSFDMREGKRPKDGGSPEGGGRRGSSLTPRTHSLARARAAAGSTAPAALSAGGLPLSPQPPRWSPPKMPVITGDAEIVEFYERDDRAFVRTDA